MSKVQLPTSNLQLVSVASTIARDAMKKVLVPSVLLDMSIRVVLAV